MRRLLYILCIISMMIMTFPIPVNAATVNLTVTGNGLYTGGTYVGGAGTWANMNSDDGDTSYVTSAGVADSRLWTFSAYASGDSINSVTLYWKSYNTLDTACSTRAILRFGGAEYYDSSQGLTGAYALYSQTWNVNPLTGLAWTTADINSSQFGVVWYPVGGSDVHTTYVYIVVDYNSLPPTVSTAVSSNNSYTGGVYSATLNGSIDLVGGSADDFRGFAYGTTSNITTPAITQAPPAGYTSNWTEGSAGFSAGAFSRTILGLAGATTYYYRAYAHNSYGWAYGVQQSFTTLATPSVSTVAASMVSPTTAQVNANVVSDGGQVCDVRFGYGTVSQPATATGFNAYTTRTAWVNNTYATGSTPFASLTGLTLGTVYYYNVQIENDIGISYGVEGTFTTTTGLYPPTVFIAIPNPTSIVLTWSKAPSSPLTYIKWSTSTFPNTTADGTLLYLGALSSTTVSNLTIGTTYYFSAWGSAGGLFSTNKITTMGTTTAGTSTVALTPPTVTTSMWVAMPSELGLVNFPLYNFFNWAFDSYTVPRATGYVILFMFLVVIVGMIIYMKAPSNNFLLTGAGVGIMLGWGTLIGMPLHCLIPIWATLAYWIVFLALSPVMNRY